MDILLTGGASRDTKLLQPSFDSSHLRCKLFDCKNHDERISGNNASRYSDRVLIGNWYEERVICPFPRDEWITVYGTDYKIHDVKDTKEDMYAIWKNRQKTQGIGRKFTVDDMTSSYDRILPKGLCGPKSRVYNSRENAWEPETELANQTKHGLADAVKRKNQDNDEKSNSPLKSIYQIDYIEKIHRKDSNDKRFPKSRGDMNTPDLRHLGINLSQASRPTAREPAYRDSRCEKICAWL